MEAELNFVDLAGSERVDNLVGNSNEINSKDKSMNKLYLILILLILILVMIQDSKMQEKKLHLF